MMCTSFPKFLILMIYFNVCVIFRAHPQMLNIMLRRINLERRRANHTQVQTLFKTCIESAATPSLATELSIKYARFLRLTLNDNATALAVLHEAQVQHQLSFPPTN